MKTKTQVGIIGAGPSGLLLSQLLYKKGIESVVLEIRSKKDVLDQARAGLLEQGTVDLIREAGASENLDKYGLVHEGVIISYNGKRHRIPLTELTGGAVVTIYGQQELTKDLIDIRETTGETILFEAGATHIEGLETTPVIHYSYKGKNYTLECDFVAGCDGFHGISRKTIPDTIKREYEKKYPYGWLGIIAKVSPSTDELIYAFHDNGFALHSMRSKEISRLYLQVDVDDSIDNWPDERIWKELQIRLKAKNWTLEEGPIIQKNITLMRSYVMEPMQYKKLFVAGDAAHIVPPTGAKGLNTAAADAKNLFDGLLSYYKNDSMDLLNAYSQLCLKRVWRTQEFSNFMTNLLHLHSKSDEFDRALQRSRFEYLVSSETAAKTLAENYVGIAASDAVKNYPIKSFND